MGQKRDLTLDIAKAICIILMVIGHSNTILSLYAEVKQINICQQIKRTL